MGVSGVCVGDGRGVGDAEGVDVERWTGVAVEVEVGFDATVGSEDAADVPVGAEVTVLTRVGTAASVPGVALLVVSPGETSRPAAQAGSHRIISDSRPLRIALRWR